MRRLCFAGFAILDEFYQRFIDASRQPGKSFVVGYLIGRSVTKAPGIFLGSGDATVEVYFMCHFFFRPFTTMVGHSVVTVTSTVAYFFSLPGSPMRAVTV